MAAGFLALALVGFQKNPWLHSQDSEFLTSFITCLSRITASRRGDPAFCLSFRRYRRRFLPGSCSSFQRTLISLVAVK